MNPPIVYEETRPKSQRTIRTTAMISSNLLLLCVTRLRILGFMSDQRYNESHL
jgi:hypothetical protein